MNEFRQIGRAVPRLEDLPLLRGAGRFVDDIHIAGMLQAAFVRSPHAHAAIRAIEAAAARKMPGVRAVLTLADLRPHLSAPRLPLQFRSAALPQDITPFVLAGEEVAYVGEAVALVIAETRYAAEDAAALVAVDFEELPAVADCRRAVEPDAPRVHRLKPSNVLTTIHPRYGDVEGAFARAPHRARLYLKQHRGAAQPLEARGVVAHYDAAEDFLTLWNSTQLAHQVHGFLMELLGLDENRVRVVAPAVGGGFGAKFVMYAEEVAIAAASLKLRAPIKWIEDRREHFVAGVQERDQYWDLEVAFETDGRLLAVRGEMIHDQGAYTPQGVNLAYNAATAVPGPYVLPAYDLSVRVVETNTVPTLPVRGAGYPEGAFAMERVLDRVAAELELDRAEVRRRNLVPADKMPYTTPLKSRSGSAIAYESGDFPKCQAAALAMLDYESFAERARRARQDGRHLGFGLANGMKGTGRGPFETGLVRIGRSGRISVYTGAMPMGQGIRTALAQICAEQFGVEAKDIAVVAGDTAAVPLGIGGSASRQTVTAGSSVHLAALAVRGKALKIASHLLEASADDLDLRGGRVEVKGVPGHGVTLREVAEAVAGVPGYAMPGDLEPGLESMQNFMPESLAYAMSCHAAEVEVDIETGAVRIRRYVVVNDSGRIINPMIAEGQIVGGAAHGIGNALLEHIAYEAGGQPLTTTFADYLLPTAPDVPPIGVKFLEFPSPLNPLGVKGIGEAGSVPASAAIISAIENALAEFGVRIEEIPLPPHRLCELIAKARRKAA